MLLGRAVTLGVLPLGTMNLLARDLGIPAELGEAVIVLGRSPTASIAVARLNGRPFLNKSALGLYPEMIIDRERRQRLFGYGRWPAMARAAWRAMRRHRMMRVRISVDGTEREIETPALVVSAAPYRFRAGRLVNRPALDAERLTVYVSHERNAMGSAGQVAKLFLGSLHRDPEFEILRARDVRIDFHRSRPVANDGEVEFIRSPLRYDLADDRLAVRYPALWP